MVTFRAIEIDASIAKGMGLPLRKLPVREEAAFRIVGDQGELHFGALAKELDDLLSDDPDLAGVLGLSLARVALFASRSADRDGGVEAALELAVIGFRWAPQDREVVANLAVAFFTNGSHREAALLFEELFSTAVDGSLVGLRVLAARNALAAGRESGLAEMGISALDGIVGEHPGTPDMGKLRNALHEIASTE